MSRSLYKASRVMLQTYHSKRSSIAMYVLPVISIKNEICPELLLTRVLMFIAHHCQREQRPVCALRQLQRVGRLAYNVSILKFFKIRRSATLHFQ